MTLPIFDLLLILCQRAATTTEAPHTIAPHGTRNPIVLPHPCMLYGGQDEIAAAEDCKDRARAIERLVAQHVSGIFPVRLLCQSVLCFSVEDTRAEEAGATCANVGAVAEAVLPGPAFYPLDWVWGLARVVVVVRVGGRGCSWWVRCEFCTGLGVIRECGSKWILVRRDARASERFMSGGKIRFVRKWARTRWHGRGAPLCLRLWNLVDGCHAPLRLPVWGLVDGRGICIGCKLRWMVSHIALVYLVVLGIFGACWFWLGSCWFGSPAEGVWDGRKRRNAPRSALLMPATGHLDWRGYPRVGSRLAGGGLRSILVGLAEACLDSRTRHLQ